ncbi:MAG: stalk domain-containing protein [Clostridia bacterium]|nr:stalk domain-containing protein [Clostridia bacterium]
MLKHKKSISVLTLAVFLLTLLLAGVSPVLAKDAPGVPPPAQTTETPSVGDTGRPNSISPEGDAVKNSIGQGPVLNGLLTPWLESMTVYYGSVELLSDNLPVALSNQIVVPKAYESITLNTDPIDLMITDRVEISTNVPDSTMVSYTNPHTLKNFTTSTPINLNPAGESTEITIKLINNKDLLGGKKTQEYTLTVHRAKVELSLDCDNNIITDDYLLMSDKNHPLHAMTGPDGIDYDYKWSVEGSTTSINTPPTNPEKDTFVVNPRPYNEGVVVVTVEVRPKGSDPEAEAFATDTIEIHVGRIDVFVYGKPELQKNGEYVATFGYESTFDVPVTIPFGNGNSFTNPLVYAPGSDPRPTIFASGTYNEVFTVRYLDSKTWYVNFECYDSWAKAGTYKTVELDCPVFMELSDPFILTATADTFTKYKDYESPVEPQGWLRQCEVVWEVVYGKDVVRIPTNNTNELTCEVTAKKPGIAIVKVSVDDGSGRKEKAYSCITVLDDRTLEIVDANRNPLNTLSIGRGSAGTAYAEISDADFDLIHEPVPMLNKFGVPGDWKQVKWGFVAENSRGWDFVTETSNIVKLDTASSSSNPFNRTNDIATLTGLASGTVTVIAYLDNNLFSWPHWLEAFSEIGLTEQEFSSRWPSYKQYLACIPEDRYDLLEVSVRNKRRTITEEEIKPAPKSAPPAPAALETLDVTLTVGSDLAMVNGEQVNLAGPTLLIDKLFGEDRAMVDYGDISKILPGVEAAWDWSTQSVTFTKGEQSLTMKLNEIPPDFDVPFMDMGGRLVVPIRYVGNFFGATVDWFGDTLVVHMYK